GEIMPRKKINSHQFQEVLEQDDFGNSSEIEELSDDEMGDITVVNIPDEAKDDDTFEAKTENVKWEKTPFTPSGIPVEDFCTPMELVCNDEHEPLSPLNYFTNFFTKDFIENVAEKTNMFYMQNTGKNLNVTPGEIQTLIGIHIEMGTVTYPQLRLYWGQTRRYDLIADAMTFNRFSNLRNNLHMVNNLDHDVNSTDKFWKVRPIMDKFLEVISKENVKPILCVNEQMIPFRGKLTLKQFVRGKPIPWGIKLFFLCSEGGMPYNFMAYQGKSNIIPEEYKDLGLGGAIVMSLVKGRVEKESNYNLFIDNFFTSPILINKLLEYGTFCTGTVRANRIGKPPIKSIKDLKSDGRGAMDGCTSTDGNMCLVKWNDNNIVNLLSSAYDWEKSAQVRRWDKVKKERIDVKCPSGIIHYNKGMEGVDQLDFYLALYRIHIKSKKWTLRVIFHFVDLGVIVSWLQYKRDCESSGVPSKEQKSLLQFRLELAEAVINAGSNSLKVSNKKSRNYFHCSPGEDVRYDGIGHFPEWRNERQRCRYCSHNHSRAASHTFCIKCNVHLCINSRRNCFLDYHKRS
ncbi:unnamed protein product, partial [Meganyctiphanes norvegica]